MTNAIVTEDKRGWDNAYTAHDENSLWGDAPIRPLAGVAELLKQRGARTVVDVGCGDGRNLLALNLAGFQCAGVDISPTALERAGKRLASRGVASLLLRGDIASLPFAAESLDAVTCFDVFGQLSDPRAVLTEFRRVLRPGGIVAINAFTTGDSEFGVGEKVAAREFIYRGTLFRFFEEEEMRDLVSGFRVLSFEKDAWIDPPHGEFRPYEHRHENWVVIAEVPSGDGGRAARA